MGNRLKLSVAAVLLSGLTSAAGAVTLTNTGVGIPGGVDAFWRITADSSGSGGLSTPFAPYIVDNAPASYAAGTWIAAPTGSNWITPYRDADPTHAGQVPAPGSDIDYTYSLTFSKPASDVVVQWSSDNNSEFFLNGDLLSTVAATGYSSLVSFVIFATDFLGGNNTITAKVRNAACDVIACPAGNPTGFLASFDYRSSVPPPSAVPIPAALPLFGFGLSALGLTGWRRRKRAAPELRGTA